MRLPNIKTGDGEKQKIIASFLLVMVSFFVIFFAFGIKYEVNDDAIISSIASGALGGHTERLIYVNIVIGYVLQAFYAISSGVNWYVLFQLAAVLGCFMVLCYVAMEKLSLFYGCMVSAIFMVLIGFDILMWFQYTKNAAVLSVTGLVLVRLALDETRRKKAVFFFSFGALMLMFGSMLRFESFMAAGALSIPFLCLGLTKQKALKVGAVFALLVAVAVGLEFVDKASYESHEQWQQYVQYNDVRTEISDHRITFTHEENAAQYGLSHSEYALIRSWNMYDPEVFTTERLHEVAQAMPEQNITQMAVETVYKSVHFLYDAPPFMLLGLLFLAFLFFGNYKKGAHFLLTFGMLFLQLLYLLYISRLPHRVEMLLVFSTAVFAALCFPFKKEVRPAKSLCGFALCAVLLFSGNYWELQQHVLIDRDGREINRPYFDVISADKDSLYIVDANIIDMMMGYDVFTVHDEGYFSNIVFLGGWHSNSPISNEKLQNYGQTNPYRALMENNTYFVTNNCTAQQAHLQQHYDASAVFVELPEQAAPNFGVFVLESGEG